MPTSLFWNAYSSAMKKLLLPGVIPPGGTEVLSLPFIVPFTNATEPLAEEAVRYLLYNLANTTLTTDPDTSEGHYAQELLIYLNTVDQSTLQDPNAKKMLERAEKDLASAEEKLTKAEADGKEQYQKVPDPKPPFEEWIETYPQYRTAEEIWTTSKQHYDIAYEEYWGRINTLKLYQDNVKKALDTKSLQPSYNMAAQKDGGDPTFVPNYTTYGLRDQLNNWIKGDGRKTIFCSVKVDSMTPSGGDAESGIYLNLTTKGVRKFDIHAGKWIIENVQALYPDRESGAPDVLNHKYVRPISFLLAYDPKLEVVIKGDSGKSTRLDDSVVMANVDSEPYVAVLGILGHHFPPK